MRGTLAGRPDGVPPPLPVCTTGAGQYQHPGKSTDPTVSGGGPSTPLSEEQALLSATGHQHPAPRWSPKSRHAERTCILRNKIRV